MRLYEVYQHLTEAQKYEQMFQVFNKVHDLFPEYGEDEFELFFSTKGDLQDFIIPKLSNHIKESRKVLKRQDRIMYYLRGVKYHALKGIEMSLITDVKSAQKKDQLEVAQKIESIRQFVQSQIDRIKNKFPYADYDKQRNSPFDGYMHASGKEFLETIEHYLSIPYQPIQDYIWDKQSPEEIINDLRQLEDDWAKKQKQIVVPQSGDKEILKISNTEGWWLLDREYCQKEGAALGHCGNAASHKPGDRILSYRSKVSDNELMPHLTFILHSDGYLGEMKGRNNQKPDKKYHPAIVKLLVEKQDIIKGIRGGGYKPENNFSVADLEDNLIEQIPDNLISPSDAYKIALKKDYRNEKMESIIAKDAYYSYMYAKNILKGKRVEKIEDAIATDAEYSYRYAAKHVFKGKRFVKGEDAIATSAEYSYQYARDVLKGERFVKGEDAIATDAWYSYYYAKDVLEGERVEKIEDSIATDVHYSYEYAKDVLKGRFEKGEDAIATNGRYSYEYARYVLEGERVEKIEDGIATNGRYSYEYARYVLEGERVEKIEDGIATDARYSYEYARDVLKGERFEKGEDAIATDAHYSYHYAKDVLKGERVEKIEDGIATSSHYGYQYARDVLKGERVEKIEDAIAKNSRYSYYYADYVLDGERVEKIEDAIATSAEYSYQYAYYVLDGKRFEKGEDVIHNSVWKEKYEKLTGVKL